MIRSLIVAALVLLAGCNGREFVKPADLGTEIARYQAIADARPDRANLTEIARASLEAARRALAAGNTERAQVELQVARDLLDR